MTLYTTLSPVPWTKIISIQLIRAENCLIYTNLYARTAIQIVEIRRCKETSMPVGLFVYTARNTVTEVLSCQFG